MKIVELSADVWKEICRYLSTETVLFLLATGSKHFRVFFAPHVLPSIELHSTSTLATIRKTLVFLLHHHRHIEHFKMHSSPWAVAIPFLGSISYPSALKSIEIFNNQQYNNREPFLHPREEDQKTLVPVSGSNVCFQSFERFVRLTELSIHYSLPAARQISDYSGYWVQFFASMPQTLIKLSLIARGYSDAIRATELLPRGLIHLQLLGGSHESTESHLPLTLQDYSSVLSLQFPHLCSACLQLSFKPDHIVNSQSLDGSSSVDPDGNDPNGCIEIGPHLQDLSLCIANVSDFPTLKVTEADDESSYGPQLSNLSIWSLSVSRWGGMAPRHTISSHFLNLPRSLKQLTIDPQFVVATAEEMNRVLLALPLTLERLFLGRYVSNPGLEAAVPRSLRSLEVMALPEKTWDFDFSSLPPKLTDLSTNCSIGLVSSCHKIPKDITSLNVVLSQKSWFDHEVAEFDHLLRHRVQSSSNASYGALKLSWRGKVILTNEFYPKDAKVFSYPVWRASLERHIPSLSTSYMIGGILTKLPEVVEELNSDNLLQMFQMLTMGFPSGLLISQHTQLTKLQLSPFFNIDIAKTLPNLVNLTYFSCQQSPELIPFSSFPLQLRCYINLGAPTSIISWSKVFSPFQKIFPPLEILHFSAQFLFPEELLHPLPPQTFPFLRELCLFAHNWSPSQLIQAITPLPALQFLQSVPHLHQFPRSIIIREFQGSLECNHSEPLP